MKTNGHFFKNLMSNFTKSSHFSHEKKTIKNNQIQKTDFNCFEECKLSNLISELEKDFDYNYGYDKTFPIYMQIWDEINKSDDHRNYVLMEAQANKGKRSDALCCFLVEQGWLVEHTNIEFPSQSRVLDDLRSDALCQQAIRKLIVKGVQEKIKFIVDRESYPKKGWAKKEHEKQESILSIVCHVLGLTADKENGAKNRLGQDPISNVVSSITNRAHDFIKKNIDGENPDAIVTHKIVDAYYRCYSNKEGLPSAEIIDKVKDEIINTVLISSNPHNEDYHTLLDDCKRPLSIEASAYRIISKVLLHPIISEKYFNHMEAIVKSRSFLQPNGEKKESIRIEKKYLATDETYHIKSSQFYKDIESHLLSINKNLTENDILLCSMNYHQYFCQQFDLDVPSIATLESLQALAMKPDKRRAVHIE
ncbi:hypothetical protein HB991_15860 [Yersinia mollaretii]|uniref:Uncharacterized protein n=1 Tax=Yersinia mollaretii TaxID=33060 RepID=A0AA44CNQ6_YERMO|nr:hypothetical protein [Yersinia mollaretii]NIL23976.1 hypothetical protein [Yersinia mollaretii]CNI95646.1 Uncharacterised protein [Yersinia mollaretii]CQQ14906.1 Uncharacterised protein [Yersinia mollaretii]